MAPFMHRFCCCGSDPFGCQYCSDGTPEEYNVVFAGITLCAGCYEPDSTGTSFNNVAWAAGDVLNAAHVLTRSALCRWSKRINGAITLDYYPLSNNCSTTAFPQTVDIFIDLTREAGHWRLDVYTSAPNNDGEMFYDRVVHSGSGICQTVPAFANQNVNCLAKAKGALGGGILSTGGTGTATPVP